MQRKENLMNENMKNVALEEKSENATENEDAALTFADNTDGAALEQKEELLSVGIAEEADGDTEADGEDPDTDIMENNALEPSELPEVIEALKNEISELRAKLEQSRAVYGRMSAELIEFSELYPEVSVASIPDGIWESARAGIPLAAAYALAEKKASVIASKAAKVNDRNKILSSGSLGNTKNEEFFSPAEVKAMSAAEVKANYDKIIASMSKWH